MTEPEVGGGCVLGADRARDESHHAHGEGGLEDIKKPSDVADETHGVDDGDLGGSVGEATSDELIVHADEEGENVFEQRPECERPYLPPERNSREVSRENGCFLVDGGERHE